MKNSNNKIKEFTISYDPRDHEMFFFHIDFSHEISKEHLATLALITGVNMIKPQRYRVSIQKLNISPVLDIDLMYRLEQVMIAFKFRLKGPSVESAYNRGVVNKIWKSIDLMRGHINPNDYHVILFLLSLIKDKLIYSFSFTSESDSYTTIEQAIVHSKYQPIFFTYRKTIENIPVFEIMEQLSEIDSSFLSKYFSKIFDAILFKLSSALSRQSGEFIQPKEISDLITALTKLPSNAKVFNPFAGLVSYGINLQEGQNYFGQEINEDTWALGMLRLMAYDRLKESKYTIGDSLLNWPDNGGYDLVIATPPFKVSLNPEQKIKNPGLSTIENFFISKGIDVLNDKGKLVTVTTKGFLFSNTSSEKQVRQKLIDSDLLETVISLPAGLLMHTSIPIVILVINKNKKNPGEVLFVDGSSFVKNSKHQNKILKTNSLLEAITLIKLTKLQQYSKETNKKSASYAPQDKGVAKFVSLEKIIDLDYDLNIGRYFLEDVLGTPLKKVLKHIKGSRISELEEGKLIRIRDLSDKLFDHVLRIDTIKAVEIKRSFRKIEQSALLLATHWKSLKPTYFRYEGTPIYLSNNIAAFSVDPEITNVSYLIAELYVPYVTEQIEAYRKGVIIPFISRVDLLNVKVNIPNLIEQNKRVNYVSSLTKEIEDLTSKRNELAHSKISISTAFNEFASLKHTLGRPRQNILAWSNNLIDFFKDLPKDKSIKIYQDFKDFYGIELISAFNEIKNDINFISELLEKGEKGLVLSKYPLQTLSLDSINKFIKNISKAGYKFTIKKQLIEGDKLNEQGINCNHELLRILVENILLNANKHGFVKNEKSNEVVVELRFIEDSLILEIKNNGKPFSKNLNKEKFIQKFSTSDTSNGSGLGGYDINRIATYFGNPDWDLILNENQIYTVKFIFKFPLIPII